MSTVSLMERPASLAVSSLTSLESFQKLEREWNALVTTSNDCFFLRHEFLRVWLESFAPTSIEVLTGRASDGRLVAALPLVRQRGSIRGIPMREVVSMSNDHSCRFDMIAEDPVLAGEAFFNYLAGQDDWDVLRIGDVPEGGQAWRLYQAAADHGYPVGAWESQRSPFLELPGDESELQGRVSSQLRSNARRRQRQMEKRGAVQFEALDEARDIDPLLDDFFAVERSGWKGRDGTACAQDDQTRAFYTRLAGVAAPRDWLALSRLTLDGQSVAFQYGMKYNGSYLLPKLAFREEYSEFSPGLVLMHEVLRHCISRNLTKIDFLGSDDEWKTRWSPAVLPHSWLYIFRNSLKGRLIQQMKFKWGPRIRSLSARGRNVLNRQTPQQDPSN